MKSDSRTQLTGLLAASKPFRRISSNAALDRGSPIESSQSKRELMEPAQQQVDHHPSFC